MTRNTGDPTVTADALIADLLADPLGPDWTVDGLAEGILDAVAAVPGAAGEVVVFDAAAVADPQSRRLIRPLLACLAAKSAAETGTPVNLYGGRLWFRRPGPVWVTGEFENRPGVARVTLARSDAPPEKAGPRAEPAAAPAGGGPRPRVSETVAGSPGDAAE